MNAKGTVPPAGELRLSQVVTTFGPGAMLDLPDYAVLVGGLEYWRGNRRPIVEERLVARLREVLKLQGVDLALFQPPIDEGSPTSSGQIGITGLRFPLWFLGMVEQEYKSPDGRIYRTRPLVPWDRLVKGKYFGEDRKSYPVVPVRFVLACVRGHISDFDWYWYVREGPSDNVGQLWLDEGGSGNDFSEIFVRCERTQRRRPLSQALLGAHLLGTCRGRQPWLGPRVSEPCDKPNRLLTRSASNAYFTQTLSAISIPDGEAKVRAAVDEVWHEYLQYAEEARDVTRERRKEKVFNALEDLSDAEVWTEIQRRKTNTPTASKGIKQAEIETLLAQHKPDGPDLPDGDFHARIRALDGLSDRFRKRLERIVLVHRLREVIALIGFTRFEAAIPDADGELDLGVQMAPLAREMTWLPAVENRGEGVFLAFSKEQVQAWLRRPGVQRRGLALMQGFQTWKVRRQLGRAEFPGLPYVMLHSLSHLLITAVALECGYSASAIRERIYAGDSGYGILLYTGSSGSEGTLGGLVEVGRNIEHHLEQALELGRLCSNDPVCGQHDPVRLEEERFLHGAACHGCLLISETCCERRNELLDRALVVPTVDTPYAAFFADDAVADSCAEAGEEAFVAAGPAGSRRGDRMADMVAELQAALEKGAARGGTVVTPAGLGDVLGRSPEGSDGGSNPGAPGPSGKS